MNKIYKITILLILYTSTNSFAINIGDKAPDILGRKTTGKLFKLSSYSGKIRLVNFFSIYCKPCKKELPELALLEKDFPEVMIIAFHIGSQSMEKVKQFLSGLSDHPDIIVRSSLEAKKTYGFRGVPHSVIIDSNDRIYKIIPGYNTQLIKTAIQEITRK